MSERYQEVFRMPPRLYLNGSPVMIETGVLQKDNKQNRILAQIKLRNITDKYIIACKVAIKAYEINDTELEGIDSFSYLDINVIPGDVFGAKTPVYLPDNTTRRIIVVVTEVIFADRTVWSEKFCEWTSVSEPKPILHELKDQELVKQYVFEAGDGASYYPEKTRGLFLCTCGAVNLDSLDKCNKCKRNYQDLMKVLDKDTLLQKKNIRLQKEQENRERIARIALEKEEKRKRVLEEKKKKMTKKIMISSIIIIFAVFLIVLLIVFLGVIVPSVKNANNYNQAVELLEQQKYDEACVIFSSLGSYKDSDEMVCESIYLYSNDSYSNGNYEKAIEGFEKILDYKDSNELFQTISLEYAERIVESPSLENLEKALPYFENAMDLEETEAIKIEAIICALREYENNTLGKEMELYEEKHWFPSTHKWYVQERYIDCIEEYEKYSEYDEIQERIDYLNNWYNNVIWRRIL